jgi:F420-dependent oxidoreductase-like protein
MKLGITVNYAGPAASLAMDAILAADEVGFDSVWSSEAWGTDAVSMLAWIGASTKRIRLGTGIMQIPARTPAMTAMTAVGLSELSGGRLILGLGMSGPQVVEGWHGVPYGKPLARTREYVSIVREAIARREPLTHSGAHYEIPYEGEDATGLGRPLKMITHSTHEIPIFLAAIGPKNVTLAAEIADGWLPIFYSPEQAGNVYGPMLREGFERSGEAEKRDRFSITAAAACAITDDLEAGYRAVKPYIALYVGGMGARGKNFYNDLACRYGYEEAAERIQELYLSGEKLAAVAAVPDELADEVALIGSKERIAERLDAWRSSGVDTLLVQTGDAETIRTLAALADI